MTGALAVLERGERRVAVAPDVHGSVRDDARDDAALLRAVADGDRPALAELYARHAPWLLARLSRRCSDRGVVDEALQDTFVAVWQSAGRWNGDGAVAAWVWGIAVRRLVDALRRTPQPAAELSEDVVPEVVASAEDTALEGLQHGPLGSALDRLPEDLRVVVRATVLDGLSTRETARLLGIPSGTVKTRMMRARARLREDLA